MWTRAIPQNNSGKIYFNLGRYPEDVLKDGRKHMKMDLGQIKYW
jgi:hypothetical protein